MLKKYIASTIFGNAANIMYLPAEDRIESHSSLNSYYRDMESSVSSFCWKISSCPNCLLAYSDSLTSDKAVYAQSNFTDEISTAIHQHNHIELVYIVSGKFHQQIADKDYYFTENELILINENTPHCEHIKSGDAVVLFLNIKNSLFRTLFYDSSKHPISGFINDLLLDKKEPYSHLYFTPKTASSLITPKILLQIIDEIYKKEPGSTHILPGLIIRLFTYITQEYQFSLRKEAKEHLNQLMFNDIENFIRSRCGNITISDLQNRYHYNADYFNRFIRKHTGQTFQQFRQNIRLEQALQLITETNINIEEISRLSGYENIGFFYQIFEKKYHITPGKMRKKSKFFSISS